MSLSLLSNNSDKKIVLVHCLFTLLTNKKSSQTYVVKINGQFSN